MNLLLRIKKVVEYFEIPTVIDKVIDFVSNQQSGIIWNSKEGDCGQAKLFR